MAAFNAELGTFRIVKLALWALHFLYPSSEVLWLVFRDE
jgi:hypothetical protein